MTFKKIQSRQIDFTDFQTNNRLGIFMVDVENSSGSNTIFIERYDAIGNIDPVVQFATAEDDVDIVIEWEGVSTIWDGKIRINDSIITRDNPNANFEAIPNSRRFRCTISNFNVVDLEQIKLEVLNQNNVSLSENIVFVSEYIATDVILFNYDFGVLNEGELNNLRFYPFNNINVTETLEPVEQSFLKEGDWVRITAEFDTIVSRVRIYDTNNVFFEDVENEIELDTPDSTFTDYLQVRETGNISNVELTIQGYNPDTELWGILRSTNEDGDDLNMESIVNINNDLPTVNIAVTIDDATKSALNINETATLDYTFPNPNFYWVNADFGGLNAKFDRNIIIQNEELGVTLKNSVIEYNLTQQFSTRIVSSLNGKTNIINTTVPIASLEHDIESVSIEGETNTSLYSIIDGKIHTLIVEFDQIIDTSQTLIVNIDNTPDVSIEILSENYDGNNKIEMTVAIYDTTLKGNLTLEFQDVRNLAGITKNLYATYIVRGFDTREISSGIIGQNFINLNIEILDEAGWNATLVNNGSPMNYKDWEGGSVMSTPAMTNVVGLAPEDQYAYTFDPVQKRIMLSQYIINTLLNNIALVSIKKN